MLQEGHPGGCGPIHHVILEPPLSLPPLTPSRTHRIILIDRTPLSLCWGAGGAQGPQSPLLPMALPFFPPLDFSWCRREVCEKAPLCRGYRLPWGWSGEA